MRLYSKYIFIALTVVLFSCEKEIQVDLPDAPAKLVVDGIIEEGSVPFIRLSKTTGYFDPTDIGSILSSIISDATITISDGTSTFNMVKVCSQSLSPEELKELAVGIGIDTVILQQYNVCAYIHPLIGEEGKSYSIDILWEGKHYLSTTTIPTEVPLDSIWYELENGQDSAGFIHSILTDPTGVYNAYRWFTKRISKFTEGKLNGRIKDQQFLAPNSSFFDDRFFDGLTLDLVFGRHKGDSEVQEEDFPFRGRFKKGDTVAIRFASIDEGVYTFLEESDIQDDSNGSPFASPINITSNVSNGALGVWAGYGFYNDTIICE